MSKETLVLMTKGLSPRKRNRQEPSLQSPEMRWLQTACRRREMCGDSRGNVLCLSRRPLPTMIGISGQSATATIRTGFHGIPFNLTTGASMGEE